MNEYGERPTSLPFDHPINQEAGVCHEGIGWPTRTEIPYDLLLAAQAKIAAEDAADHVEWERYEPWTMTSCSRRDCKSGYGGWRGHTPPPDDARCRCGASLTVDHAYSLKETDDD